MKEKSIAVLLPGSLSRAVKRLGFSFRPLEVAAIYVCAVIAMALLCVAFGLSDPQADGLRIIEAAYGTQRLRTVHRFARWRWNTGRNLRRKGWICAGKCLRGKFSCSWTPRRPTAFLKISL